MWFVSDKHTASNFMTDARNQQKQAASSDADFLQASLFNPEDCILKVLSNCLNSLLHNLLSAEITA
jgi:hypothetical protein